MGVVNQRVCDLAKCAQPITAETLVLYVMPAGNDGEPDLSRRAEFETGKCVRTFVRDIDRTAKDARLAKLISETTANAANKEKIAGYNKALSGKDAVEWPTQPAKAAA